MPLLPWLPFYPKFSMRSAISLLRIPDIQLGD